MKMRKWLVGISCIFLISMMSIGSVREIHPLQSKIEMNNLKIEADSPILIMNNAGLAGIASSGNGSIITPYIIENYVINGTGSAHGIQIYNTNLHFIIRNCTILHTMVGGGGIRLDDVLYGQIVNNTVMYADTGIELSHTNLTTVYNNSIRYNAYGLEVLYSFNNSIYNNSINDNSYTGIHLVGASFNIISFNTINYDSVGLLLLLSSNNNFTFNNLLENTRCISEDKCSGNYFFGNECEISIDSFLWVYSVLGLFVGSGILLLFRKSKMQQIKRGKL